MNDLSVLQTPVRAVARQRPRVTVQAAQTLDGKIALPQRRTPLSSREGLEIAHRARAEHDAVLVGSSTVRIDNPELSVRYCPGSQPRRVILATSLDVSPTSKVFTPGPGVMVIGVKGVATPANIRRLQSVGARVRLVGSRENGWVSMREALVEIHQWGVRRLLVEGGARVHTTLFRERLVDEVVLEIVPIILGAPAVSSVADIGVTAISEAPRLTDITVTQLGGSVWVRGRLESSAQSGPPSIAHPNR